MKNFLIAIVLIFVVNISYSQNYINLVKPAGSKEWGYMNLKGELVIPAKFRKCFEFSDGYGVVLNEGSKQYYFIDAKGNTLSTEISNFKLKEVFGFGVKGFSNGMAPVKVGEQWGFLNTSGKLAIPIKYSNVSEFYEGYAIGELGIKRVIISSDGSEVPADQQAVEIKHFSEGLAPFTSANKNAGFMDTKGQVVIPAKFLSVGYFSNGVAWAKTENAKVGYINKKGDWVIDPKFTMAMEFDPQSGMARVKNGDQWGYINMSGEPLSMALEKYNDFVEGLCSGKRGENFGFYDNKGSWVIEPQFEGVRDFRNGYAAAKKNLKWGIIDKKGQWVIQPTFDSVKDMELVP